MRTTIWDYLPPLDERMLAVVLFGIGACALFLVIGLFLRFTIPDRETWTTLVFFERLFLFLCGLSFLVMLILLHGLGTSCRSCQKWWAMEDRVDGLRHCKHCGYRCYPPGSEARERMEQSNIQRREQI
jgi:hypothetical protein